MMKYLDGMVILLIAGSMAMADEPIRAQTMRDEWILDGQAELTVLGEHELRIATPEDDQTTLWSPRVVEGPAVIEFDCRVEKANTKLLLMAYGHGADGEPIASWQRTAKYNEYNAGRMRVYTIAINRGPHTGADVGEQLANVRRIGGPEFAHYTSANFAARDRAFWEKWNRESLIGGAREPISGVGRYLHYRVELEPPVIRISVEGECFAELVDHHGDPLGKGSFGFRNMSPGCAFSVRDVVIAPLK